MKKLLFSLLFIFTLTSSVFAKTILFDFGTEANVVGTAGQKEEYLKTLAEFKRRFSNDTFVTYEELLTIAAAGNPIPQFDIIASFIVPADGETREQNDNAFYLSILQRVNSNPNTLHLQVAGSSAHELNYFNKPIEQTNISNSRFSQLNLEKKIKRGKITSVENNCLVCPNNLVLVGGLYNGQIDQWSNYGPDITVYAEQGVTAWKDGACRANDVVLNKCLNYMNQHPELTAAQVKEWLVSQADPNTKFLSDPVFSY